MARFHPFNDLPKELRDLIWDMAIRDDNPAVHFLSMYDTREDPDSVIDPTKKVHVTRDPEVLSWPYTISFYTGLAAPRDRKKGRSSWTDGNISTYLEDSGLWTACHESRERMLRHFKPCETSPLASRRRQLNQSTVLAIRDKPEASVHMEFTRDNGERQYLSIRPCSDLICLQPLEGSVISFGTDEFEWEFIGQFPLFRWRSDYRYSIYSSINNVAVEYDPAWESCGSDLLFWRVNGAFKSVYEFHRLETFWFIDYRLTRKYKAERRDERRMFHAGRLTFIEVSRIDSEWCCCPKGGCPDRCILDKMRFSLDGAHALADYFESYHDLRFEIGTDDDRSWFHGDYGVLACVDLESEGELPTDTEWFEMNEEAMKGVGF